MAIDGISRDDDSLDELVWIALHYDAVFACSGFALVGVAAQIDRLSGILRDEAPFQSRRETRAAAASQSGRLRRLDDLLWRQFLDNFLRSPVPAQLYIPVDFFHPRIVNVLKQHQFVRHTEEL